MEWFNSCYKYEDHHTFLGELLAGDIFLVANGSDWVLTMQYGRIADAVTILEERLRMLEILEADKMSASRDNDLALGLACILLTFHVHGQPQMVQKLIETCGDHVRLSGRLPARFVSSKLQSYGSQRTNFCRGGLAQTTSVANQKLHRAEP